MVRKNSIHVKKTVTDVALDEDQPWQPPIQGTISAQAHNLEVQSTGAG
jgi:hypothetical protein